MNTDFYYLLIHKALSGQITKAEQDQLDTWLNDPDKKKEYDRFKFIFDNEPIDDDVDQDHFKLQQARLEENLRTVQRDELRQYKSSLIYRNVAVMVLTIVLFTGGIAWVVNSRIQKDVQVSINDRILALTDGTKVTLNQGAELSFTQTENLRSVKFKGEAFFNVARDEEKPFVVELPKGRVKVLGTSFFVRANPGDTALVVVTTGVVKIESAIGSVTIIKGETGLITQSGKAFKMTQSLNRNFNAWYTGKLDFENVALKDIVPQLEHEYHLKMNVKNVDLLSCRFTGSFDNESIDQVLNIMAQVLHFDFYLENGVYIIDGLGCKKDN